MMLWMQRWWCCGCKDDDIVDAKMMMGWLQTKQRVQHEQEAGVALPELMSNNSNPLLLIMIMMFLEYMITMTMQEIRMQDIFERDPPAQRERGGRCDVALCLNCTLHWPKSGHYTINIIDTALCCNFDKTLFRYKTKTSSQAPSYASPKLCPLTHWLTDWQEWNVEQLAYLNKLLAHCHLC